jgi:hypothetical protein
MGLFLARIIGIGADIFYIQTCLSMRIRHFAHIDDLALVVAQKMVLGKDPSPARPFCLMMLFGQFGQDLELLLLLCVIGYSLKCLIKEVQASAEIHKGNPGL